MGRIVAALVTAGMVGSGLAWAAATPTPAPESEFRDAALIQAMIDAAPAGGEVVPAPGRYRGGIVITRPVVLDGRGAVTIDAGGSGSVVWVRTDNATVKNLRLVNTGTDHNGEDAGIQVRGNNNVIKDNVIEDCLFGIDLEQSDRNVLRRNRIASKQLDLGMRGDSLKLWYSNHNLVEDNHVKDSRDFVLWYSRSNRVRGNLSEGGRYGLHFMFSAENEILDNRFVGNSAGISMMYNEGDVLRGNHIAKSIGATGTCISLKEASRITIEDNDILYCASGIVLDVSPFQPDTTNLIRRNRIAYNDIAIGFANDWAGNVFEDNALKGNITEVVVYGGGSAKRNQWRGNRWEDYQGFDRDGDGIGNTPHRVYGYAGRVWMDVPNTRFFKGSPVLEVLDFLDRLAPFSNPVLLLEDDMPRLGSATTERQKAAEPRS